MGLLGIPKWINSRVEMNWNQAIVDSWFSAIGIHNSPLRDGENSQKKVDHWM